MRKLSFFCLLALVSLTIDAKSLKLTDGTTVSQDKLATMIEDKFLSLVNDYRRSPDSFRSDFLAAAKRYQQWGLNETAEIFSYLAGRHLAPLTTLQKITELCACCRQHVQTMTNYSCDYIVGSLEAYDQVGHGNYSARRLTMEQIVWKKTSQAVAPAGNNGGEIVQACWPINTANDFVSADIIAREILISFLGSPEHRELIEEAYLANSWFGAGAVIFNNESGLRVHLVCNFLGR